MPESKRLEGAESKALRQRWCKRVGEQEREAKRCLLQQAGGGCEVYAGVDGVGWETTDIVLLYIFLKRIL